MTTDIQTLRRPILAGGDGPSPVSANSSVDDELSEEELRVLALLKKHTYDEVRQLTSWSRGRIYSLALRTGARKNELRIRERAQERFSRQLEMLAEFRNKTVTADVLDFLDALPDNSVNAHITSVPYNVGKKYGDAPSADSMAFLFYQGWLAQIVSEMARTLVPGGVAFINVGKTRDEFDNLYPIDVFLFDYLRRAGLSFQSRIVWTMSHGLTPSRRLSERYETVLVFSKGAQATFNPNVARTPQKQPDKRAFKGPNRGELSGHPYGAWPSDVWVDISQCGHNHPDTKHGRHPAQFPVRLAKRAILLYTLPGQLIADCFSGSGSSQVAAYESGRDFVGADLFYADLREKRLATASRDCVTPLPGVSDESVAVWQAEARRVDRRSPVVLSAEQEFDLFSGLIQQ